MKLLSFVILVFSFVIQGRSIFRTRSPHEPMITTRWAQDTKHYSFKNSHLEEEPLFKVFDKQHFLKHQLPMTPITFRYQTTQSVTGEKLGAYIHELIDEVMAGKTSFKHFNVLKKRDFRRRKKIGLLIVKFKNYPFVVKLFIETPESFVQPFSKGFEPICFFYMGGGVNRHLSGFTRIKNLEFIQNKIKNHPYWSEKIGFPRKWFWQPNNNKWIELAGTNIGTQGTIKTEFPSIYAIIADEIKWTREFQLWDTNDRNTAMSLSNFLNQRIDPHINNFGIEINSGKIVPIDFELFPLIAGLKEGHRKSDGYLHWYTGLALKMLKDTFGRTKQERLVLQKNTIISYLHETA